MRYIFILLLSGCSHHKDYERATNGCESFSYLCISCYQSCGEKEIKYHDEKVKEKIDGVKQK